MQEPQVRWDPAYIDRVIPWQTAFTLYLFIVCIIWLIRTLALFRQLYFFSRAKCAALCEARNEDTVADLLAASALAGKIPVESPSGRRGDACPIAAVEKAGARFLNLWEVSSDRSSSLKRLVILTLLLTMLTFAWGGVVVFREITYSHSVGIAVVSWGLSEMFVPLALGSFISTIIYATYAFYERVLARRRISWSYFCAAIKSTSQGRG